MERRRTATAQRTVVGLFDNRSQAEDCVRRLEAAGFNDRQIGITGPGSEDRKETSETTRGTQHAEPKGAVAGIPIGAAAGGILGALAAGLIPGIGPIIAGGVLAGVIGGAVAGGAVGGIAGALIGAGIPEDEARYYENEVKAGRWLVTCEGNGRSGEAEQIIRSCGGRMEWSGGQDRRQNTVQEMSQRMPLHEERMQVNKESEQTGEARLRKDVVSERQHMDVPVTHDEVSVERHRVEPREARTPVGQGQQEISTPLREEQANVTKKPVVTEEVELKKRQVTENERVSDEVKKEIPRVDVSDDGDDER
jgi:uncharacterized protein (TIGR02271 family)